jgi:hypothetical protein
MKLFFMKRKPVENKDVNSNTTSDKKKKNGHESKLVFVENHPNNNDKPGIDFYEKFIEISFSIAAEKQVFSTYSSRKKYNKRQGSTLSTLTVKGGTKSLKTLPYAVRRYVFQRSNALSKTSTVADVSCL